VCPLARPGEYIFFLLSAVAGKELFDAAVAPHVGVARLGALSVLADGPVREPAGFRGGFGRGGSLRDLFCLQGYVERSSRRKGPCATAR